MSLFLPAVLCGDIFILVVVGERAAEKVRSRTVVFCNKVKRFGLFGEERCFNSLAARI